MQALRYVQSLTALAAVSSMAAAAGQLSVENAWIRSAPPGVDMLAGYATLKNTGDARIVITGAHSEAFGDVSLHATVTKDGMQHMQELGEVVIEAGKSFVLAPGGNHLMLMEPKHPLHEGDKVTLQFTTQQAASVPAIFQIRAQAPK